MDQNAGSSQATAEPGAEPPELAQAAAGKDVGEDGERSVLDYLCGRTYRPAKFVDVEFETPDGKKKLRAFVQALDERRLDEIDGEHRTGDGPFSKLDVAGFNSALVAEAVTEFADPVTGKRVQLDSHEFVGEAPNLSVAVEGRFKFQPGILAGLAERVREISGYSNERVGTAQRVIETAVGNSSTAGG